jgi:hypothetical protein
MAEQSVGDQAQVRLILEQAMDAAVVRFNAGRGKAAVSRAEWIAVGALALNVGTLVFGLGVVWADVQDHERRIEMQERKTDVLVPKVERIDANVSFLAERAREDREKRK